MAGRRAEVVDLTQNPRMGKSNNEPPRRRPNKELRPRDYLTEDEVEQLIKAAGKLGRHPHRDATAILVAFTHGLRVSELVAMRWSDLDFNNKRPQVHVRRQKGGKDTVHPLRGREVRALRKLRRQYPESAFVFCSERGGGGAPMTGATFRKMLARASDEAELGFRANPHALRHACGFRLANMGTDTRSIQSYLGHSSITSTTRYAELAAGRFDDFWRD